MKLRQVLINLLGNAVKFTADGTVTLRIEVAAGDALQFSVTDTGPGIAPEDLARLFEPFSQTDSGRQVQGGTGLGLALCTQYVGLMGGALTVGQHARPGELLFIHDCAAVGGRLNRPTRAASPPW